MKSFEISFRVYYEDTDADAVMYHGAYLDFAERARTEFLRHIGTSIRQVNEEMGFTFVVRHIDLNYLAPARLDDLVKVITTPQEIRNSSFIMQQDFYVDDVQIASIKVILVCVSLDTIKPVRMAQKLRDLLTQ